MSWIQWQSGTDSMAVISRKVSCFKYAVFMGTSIGEQMCVWCMCMRNRLSWRSCTDHTDLKWLASLEVLSFENPCTQCTSRQFEWKCIRRGKLELVTLQPEWKCIKRGKLKLVTRQLEWKCMKKRQIKVGHITTQMKVHEKRQIKVGHITTRMKVHKKRQIKVGHMSY